MSHGRETNIQAQKYQAEVGADGTLALPPLRLKAGTAVEVIVLVRDRGEPPDAEGPAALLAASQSSTAFWDNPVDDEVWNDA